MYLKPSAKIYRYPGVWTVGFAALFTGLFGGALALVEFANPTFLPSWAIVLILGAAMVSGGIYGAIYSVSRGNRILEELRLKVRGSYGFDLNPNQLERLLPYKNRFQWYGYEESYGTVHRRLTAQTLEAITLVRRGTHFHLRPELKPADAGIYTFTDISPKVDRVL